MFELGSTEQRHSHDHDPLYVSSRSQMMWDGSCIDIMYKHTDVDASKRDMNFMKQKAGHPWTFEGGP